MAATATAAANEKKIFVGNLDFGVTAADLTQLFEAHAGPVEGVNIRRDRVTKQPRGFAFVTFADAADAQRALATMQNTVHKGRTLTIKPQIARGQAATSQTGAKKHKKKGPKSSLWGSKKNDGWHVPTANSGDTEAELTQRADKTEPTKRQATK